MLELVQGEGGVYQAEPEFVAKLSTLCKEHGVRSLSMKYKLGWAYGKFVCL
ncbi:hypothetical protein [Bacillus sp. FJAT-50079]|uniref:hypothetical protein n=1 Tax=Bacillus sp. FJAT-50079 TaxID=2833577 RepID=UPI0024B55A86|nr:hypothetical protein [Bacillus sp. FJAT-50079]